MSGPSLTAEQLRRIEENKRKALAKLAQKNKQSQNGIPCNGQPASASNTAGITNIVHSSIKPPSSSESAIAGGNFKAATSNSATYGKSSNLCQSNNVKQNNISVQNGRKIIPLHSDSSVPSASDRIEQNRLKALAKRAEKLKSPLKQSSKVEIPSAYNLEDCSANTVTRDQSAQLLETSKNSFASYNKTTSSQTNSHIANSDTKNATNVQAFQKGVNVFSGVPWERSDSQSKSTENEKSAPLQPSSSDLATKTSGFFGAPSKGECILVSRDRFTVKIGYCTPLIELFKTMNTKLYDASTKRWTLGLSEYNKFMSACMSLKPAVTVEPLPKALLNAFALQIKGANPSRDIPIADLSHVEQSLVTSLMSFQRKGVDFGVYKNGRVLIADDMGLGKTIQAICLARFYKDEWPLLVVVPSSVRFDWSQQFQRWIPSLDPQSVNVVVTGKDSCTSGLINILSYDLMARQAETLNMKRFQVIIMDECHLLKNYKTARCRAAMPLLQAAKRVILLSGTPALSRPSELYTQIMAVCPYLFKFNDFGVRYCDGRQERWGWDYTGSSNMEELQILLEEKVMIRRLKKHVLTELPDKIRKMILLDPGSIKVSRELRSASKVMTSANLKKKDEQGALLDFFHKSGFAKMNAIKNYVDDLLEGENKFLIFGHHGDILDGIEETVKSKIGHHYIRIDGKTSSEQRNVLCQKFQHSDDVRVAILSITACNAGLNLSAANLVVFAELFWNPGILVQAEDRAHRIGQQDLVVVQYLVATGTSDDHIWPMIQKKLDVLGRAGLTKDNFSSAETTQLTDQRQMEISQFLNESFHIETSSMLEDPDDIAEQRPSTKSFKQQSILKFASPVKDLPVPASPTSCLQKPRQQTLFSAFGKTTSALATSSSDRKPRSVASNVGQGQKCKGQGQTCDLGDEFNDLEEFLDVNGDDWEGDECDTEPANKKQKI